MVSNFQLDRHVRLLILMWFSLLAGIGVVIILLPEKLIFLFILALMILMISGILMASFEAYRIAIIGFTFLLFATFDVLGYKPILSYPVNIFFADGIIILLMVLLLRSVYSRNLFPRHHIREISSPITGILLLNLLYGFISIIVGLAAGHNLNYVMGDFRRFFFYPLSAIVALSCLAQPKDFRRLIFLFGLSLVAVCGVGLTRVITGQTFDPQQFAGTSDFRAISYFSGSIVLMGISLFYGLSFTRTGFRKLGLIIFVGLLIGVALVSGYRLLWVLTLLLPLFVTFLSFFGQKRISKLVSSMILVTIILVACLFIVRSFFPEWYVNSADKFATRVLGFDFQNNIRYYAWQAAWEKFLSSPLFGVGIGDRLEFLAPNSQGALQARNLTTHNIALSLLYQSGVIGLVLFLVFHLIVIKYVWRGLNRIRQGNRFPLVGMLGGYLAALSMAMVQPALETPGAIVGLYLWIGLLLRGAEVLDEGEELNHGVISEGIV